MKGWGEDDGRKGRHPGRQPLPDGGRVWKISVSLLNRSRRALAFACVGRVGGSRGRAVERFVDVSCCYCRDDRVENGLRRNLITADTPNWEKLSNTFHVPLLLVFFVVFFGRE